MIELITKQVMQISYQITYPKVKGTTGRKCKGDSGYFVRYYKNSDQKESEGKLINGLMSDVWRFYFRNGYLKSETEYENGIKVQTIVSYYETGEKESQFDEKNRVFTQLYKNGNLKSVIQYLAGNKEGSSIEWYENGAVKREYLYYQHHEHGIYKEYNWNSRVALVSVCREIQSSDNWQAFYPDRIFNKLHINTSTIVYTKANRKALLSRA